jgi:hypothetical protein
VVEVFALEQDAGPAGVLREPVMIDGRPVYDLWSWASSAWNSGSTAAAR